MENFPRISIVSPNFNQVKFIEETILSVLDQNYPNLEYIIIDGGSTDGSLEIIKKYQTHLSYWISERDKGMYDAINKGFKKASGEIFFWLNSDDILQKNSLNTVAKIFQQHPRVKWLQGYPTVLNEEGKEIFTRDPVYSKFYFYFHKHEKDFSFIQQESTFWKRELWEMSGGYVATNYKLAADFDLWMRFFNYEKLYCTKRKLGAFRLRRGQQSEDRNMYILETRKSLISNFRNLDFRSKAVIKVLFNLEKVEKKFRWKFLVTLRMKVENHYIRKPTYTE